jgi:hypothetical protein
MIIQDESIRIDQAVFGDQGRLAFRPLSVAVAASIAVKSANRRSSRAAARKDK